MSEDTTPNTTAAPQTAAEPAIRFGYASAPLLPATISVDLTALAEAALARSRGGASTSGAA
ncbi:hypothetical protein [Humibacter sp. RRB41]|uniref:hypothetical protein n=1 Tax=Humibacter sp. RRB41 TaxID=2919946 RepID=UPI001FA98063|nr:hypothetical protein [Humibacter sp. RRB41]